MLTLIKDRKETFIKIFPAVSDRKHVQRDLCDEDITVRGNK